MQKIKDLLNKKASDSKFKGAGTGHKLTESHPQTQPSGNNAGRILGSGQSVSDCPKPTSRSGTGPDTNVVNAALARFGKSSTPNLPTLAQITEEEKKKAYEEAKTKQIEEAKNKQFSELISKLEENPFKEFEESQKYTCKTLDLNEPLLFNDIIRMIKSKIFDNFPEEPIFRSILIIFNCNRTIDRNDSKVKAGVEVLLKIISNLLVEDKEQLEKFKRLRASKLEQKVLCLDGALDFLFAIGFSISSEDPDWMIFQEDVDQFKVKAPLLIEMLSLPEIFPIELDRNVNYAILEPSKGDSVCLELTSSDLKKFHQTQQTIREIEEMCISKETKAKLISSTTKFKPIFTQLRFKFEFSGDMQMIQAVFYSKEKLFDVRKWFVDTYKDILSGKTFKYKIGLTSLDDESKTLEELKLSPAATLLVVISD